VALVGLLPACAAALGLGEVQSKSFLNQPFSAEIPISTDFPGELAGFSISLAPPETFDQYGLPRPSFLNYFSFTVVPTAQGGMLRITSATPIVEPFVTLLIEARWPQGRLLREYTVLLDPPSFAAASAVESRVEIGRPASAQPESSSDTTEATGSPADGMHRVARKETLWGIADRYRTGGDINQMMMAIYRANPDAFAGNINRLSAGALLRIPGAAEVGQVAADAAGSEVRRQTNDWAASSAAATTARLELVPPPETVVPVPPATGAQTGGGAADDEARRLLAVKDAELQALRQRVADLERQAGNDVAVEDLTPPPLAEEPPVAAEAPGEDVTKAPVEAEPPAARVDAEPARAQQRQSEDTGIVGTITSLLGNLWLWISAAVVVVAALLFARRRSADEDAREWKPTPRQAAAEQSAAIAAATGGNIVLEETWRAQTDGFERPAGRGDQELPLERTISTDGPVNLDQSDPLAEADFHMAYGLYDQSADLLSAAISREPARRDLQMKLMDVHFVWENRDSFIKEARALRDRIGNDADADWKRVLIMGKQLCPDEALFAGGASTVAEDMDLALTAAGGGTVDLPIAGGSDGGLDFDLGADETDANAPTQLAERRWSNAPTQEVPTKELPRVDSASTMETPTIESRAYRSSTTMEMPTIKAQTLGARGSDTGRTTKMRIAAEGAGEDRGDQTAEIDLEELGLDLAGLDDAAKDMATGLLNVLTDDDSPVDFDLDLSGEDLDGGLHATNDMDRRPELHNIVRAMGRDDSKRGKDTVGQPGLAGSGDTRSSPALSGGPLDIEIGDLDGGGDLTATGLRSLRRPEDPTMTEVGTKLDLARAYVDMGDPENARSILNEVLEEGDPSQQQEARHLMDQLRG